VAGSTSSHPYNCCPGNSVVVPPLGPPEFVASEQHTHTLDRNNLARKLRCSGPEGQNGDRRRAFHAQFQLIILVRPSWLPRVAAFCFLVVTDQIMQVSRRGPLYS